MDPNAFMVATVPDGLIIVRHTVPESGAVSRVIRTADSAPLRGYRMANYPFIEQIFAQP
jgi:hypothetical protein